MKYSATLRANSNELGTIYTKEERLFGCVIGREREGKIISAVREINKIQGTKYSFIRRLRSITVVCGV